MLLIAPQSSALDSTAEHENLSKWMKTFALCSATRISDVVYFQLLIRYHKTRRVQIASEMCLLTKLSLGPCLRARTDKQHCPPLSRWWSLQARHRGGFLGDTNYTPRKGIKGPTCHKFRQLGYPGGSGLYHHQHFWVLIDLRGNWLKIIKQFGRTSSRAPFPPIRKRRLHQAGCWRRQPTCQKPSQRPGT